jgi:hypothetical protein
MRAERRKRKSASIVPIQDTPGRVVLARALVVEIKSPPNRPKQAPSHTFFVWYYDRYSTVVGRYSTVVGNVVKGIANSIDRAGRDGLTGFPVPPFFNPIIDGDVPK